MGRKKKAGVALLTEMKLAQFDEMYALLQASFPPEEYRPYEAQKALLNDPRYRVLTERQNGELCAVMAVWDLETVTFLEHFAVAPELRGGGLGGRMLRELIESSERPVCLEAELPETEIARRRIGFYQRGGMTLCESDYMQPSLGEGREAIPLRIMCSEGNITKNIFLQIKSELYQLVYHIEA